MVSKVKTFFESHGKVPIVLNREVEGYLINRLFFIMWREMLDLVARDVVSPTELDRLFCTYNVHWGIGIGPMLRTHIHGGSREKGGIDAALEYYSRVIPPIWNTVATWTTVPDDVRSKVADRVKEMKAVKEHSIEEILRVREARLVKVYRKFKQKDLDSLYV